MNTGSDSPGEEHLAQTGTVLQMTDNGDPAQHPPAQWSYDQAHVPPAAGPDESGPDESAPPEHSPDHGDGPIFGTSRTGAIPPIGAPDEEPTADAAPYDPAQYGAPQYGAAPHETGELGGSAPEGLGRHSQFGSDGFPDVHYYGHPGAGESTPASTDRDGSGAQEAADSDGVGPDGAAGADELTGAPAVGQEQAGAPTGSYPTAEFGSPFGLPPAAPFYADAGPRSEEQHPQDQGQHAQGQPDQAQQGQGQYDQNLYAQNPYDQNSYRYDQNQYPYDQNPYGRDAYGRDAYGRDPYGRDQYTGGEPQPYPPAQYAPDRNQEQSAATPSSDQQRHGADPTQQPARTSSAGQPGPQQQPGQQQPGQQQPGQQQSNQQPSQQPADQQQANQQQAGQSLPGQTQDRSQPSSHGTPAPAPDASRPRGPLPTAAQPRPEALLVPSHRASATQAAQSGWQGRVRRLTGGAIKPQPSAQELADRKDGQDIQRTFSRPMTIVVVQPKGGAGKTPATIALSSALGAHRGGYVVGWDDNETRGTLAVRVDNADKQTTTVWDLLRDLGMFERTNARVGDLSHYVRSQGAAQFDALVSDDSPGNMAQIGESEFKRIHTVLQRFYRQIVVDTGNNVRSPNWQAAVNAADQIVVVSTYQRDVGYSGSWVLDHLIETGRAELAAGAITVLSAADPRPDPAVRRELIEHFGARTRAVVEIPYDPLIALGGPIEWMRLKPETRRAWTHAGAGVVTALAAQDEAERLATRTSG